MKSSKSALVLLALSTLCAAQQPPKPTTADVVVLGTFDPITEGESARSVALIDTQENRLAFSTVEDYLQTDTASSIRSRGAGGVQSDISIRGTSFEQTLVLVNGFRINDVETSHFNLDSPVPLDATGTINILHGAGSTLYGSDAIGGVVDFLTFTPTANSLRLRAGWGDHGGNRQGFTGSIVHGKLSEVLSGDRDVSDGFLPDRDYQSREASSETRLTTPIGDTDILLAGSDRPFGANQFYGNYNSFERTKGWFAGLNQGLGEHSSVDLAYRRHTDIFILFRDNPAAYENQHIDENWQADLRRSDRVHRFLTLFYGLEEATDQIRSNALGNHGRNSTAGYVAGELRLPQRATVSVGLRDEVLSGGRNVFSPSVSGSYWLPHDVKLRANVGYGFRRPTYTDLYYVDPTHAANPNLQPESAWNYEGGADWYGPHRTTASATFFYSRQQDAIDYTRPTGSTGPYTASNLDGLRYTGIEAALSTQRPLGIHGGTQNIRLAYTFVNGAQSALNGLQSLYAADYAVHNASLEWTGRTQHDLVARTRVGVTQRYQQTAFPLWDLSLTYERHWFHPYLQFANLANTGYADILLPAVVRNPGRSITGGIEFDLHRRTKN